jgi:hypothetical protein
MMPITDQQMVALRAFLTNDADGMAPLAYQLGDQGIGGYVRLADAALSLLASRHFLHYTNADVIRYVAAVRAERIADDKAYDFEPTVGENIIFHSLGKKLPPPNPKEWVRAVVGLLDDLSASELLTLADVDELLAEARALADRRLPGEHIPF